MLDTDEAAQVLKCSSSWLNKARGTGEGPDYTKVGRSVRYSVSSLVKFIKSRTRKSTSETDESEEPDESHS
jgi:hypothetical protein